MNWRVQRLHSLARVWLPAAIGAILIFAASSDALSDERTSRFLGPILHWLVPGIDDQTVQSLRFWLRKGMHLTEYAVLAVLLLRGFTRADRLWPRFWSWRYAGWTLGFCLLYAITDELHQSLVPSRYGSPVDVAIDTAGAVLGLAVTRWVLRSTSNPGAPTPSPNFQPQSVPRRT